MTPRDLSSAERPSTLMVALCALPGILVAVDHARAASPGGPPLSPEAGAVLAGAALIGAILIRWVLGRSERRPCPHAESHGDAPHIAKDVGR